MPLHYSYKTQSIPVPAGFDCDICQQHFDFAHYHANGIDEFSSNPHFFHAKHCFGFGSIEDGSKVEITVCDPCFLSFCHQHKININRCEDQPDGMENTDTIKTKSQKDWKSIGDDQTLECAENFYGFSGKNAENHPANGKSGYWEVSGIRHKAIVTTDNAISALELASDIVYEWELCDVKFIGETLPTVYRTDI